MARSRNKPGVGFKIFAIGMVFVFGVGSILVVGVSIFGDDGGSTDAQDIQDPGVEQVTALLTAVSEDPEDATSAALLANILLNSGRQRESLEYFEIAIQGDPSDAGLRLSYGIALFQTANLFDAEVQLLKAYELDESEPLPAYYLGQLFETRETPDLEKAVTWYETAIDISPEGSVVAGQARERIDSIAGLDVSTETP